LRAFGAKIGKGSIIHASAEIWAPWNLEVGQITCVGPHAILYNPGKIRLGSKVVISQYSYLCTATHQYDNKLNTLYWKDINVCDYAWIAADSFVGPGVTIGEGAVVGARGCVFKDVEPWTVVGGNPAKFIKKRVIDNQS
jgi:putative colanic acid biosynthesis acetyltransferase WcaF